jgi:hypothetical protein
MERNNIMNKKEIMYQRIEKHGQDLNKIFNTGIEPIALCKKLRRLEVKANKLAEDYCNGTNGIDSENWEDKTTPLMEKVYKILNNGIYKDERPHQRGVPIFLNGDCRGYSLKINDDYVRLLEKRNKTIYKDWGGYGIIAPDLTE